MLTLRHSPASPFVRKIRIAASVLGLDREIALEAADTTNAGDTIRSQNPWRKDHPRLAAWLDDFAGRVPVFAATAPPS